MRLLSFLLLLLFSLQINAQTIAFPDSNLKVKLLASGTSSSIAQNSFGNNIKIDANSDGEIQVSEAQNVFKLDISTNILTTTNDIVNVTGIENFNNLRVFNCSGNQIQNLNLTSFTFLEEIKANNGILNSVNLSGLSNLKKINFNHNNLSSINIDNLDQLTELFVYDNNLTSLSFNNNPNITSINCRINALNSLDLTSLTSLLWIGCDSNQLTSINVSGLTQLQELVCYSNNLTELNVDGLTSLRFLNFGVNQIATINLSTLNSIEQIYCSQNPLSSINIDGLSTLISLDVSETLISTIDCSQSGVTQLISQNCPNLQTINLNNNHLSYSDPDLLFYAFIIGNNPQLVSICVDNGEQNNLSLSNYNTSGFVQVFTGSNCDILIEVTMANEEFVSDFDLKISPNPTSDSITFQTNNQININSVYIYTASGQLVYKQEKTDSINSIDITNLSSGIYFITIQSNFGKSSRKFIKL